MNSCIVNPWPDNPTDKCVEISASDKCCLDRAGATEHAHAKAFAHNYHSWLSYNVSYNDMAEKHLKTQRI